MRTTERSRAWGLPYRDRNFNAGGSVLHCFICRGAVGAHVITALESVHDPDGWTLLCVPCAMRHELDGTLVAGPEDREVADRWEEYRDGPQKRRSPIR